MPKKRKGTLPYRVAAGTWTVRESDRIKLAAHARNLSRVFRQDVNESAALRNILEQIKTPDEVEDADLFHAYLQAIEREGGHPAIMFPQADKNKP